MSFLKPALAAAFLVVAMVSAHALNTEPLPPKTKVLTTQSNSFKALSTYKARYLTPSLANRMRGVR